MEYINLKSYLAPSGVKPVYNRVLHKLSFKQGTSVAILSPISDVVCVKGKTETFKKPLIYKDGTFYISRQAAIFVSPIFPYKIERPVVILDPGHGGYGDDGLGAIARYNGREVYEKNITLRFSKILGEDLENKGYDVKYTRKKDVKVDLRARTKMSNRDVGEVYISLHANASSDPDVKGADVFYMSEDAEDDYSKAIADAENQYISKDDIPTDETGKIVKSMLASAHIMESSKLAYDISTNIPEKIGNRGVKKALFTVLSGASMPAVLVEIGFMSNIDDLARLHNETELKDLAEGITNGIDTFLITYKGKEK
jgi:N-acetylmuramoyl-L-alanine amidase